MFYGGFFRMGFDGGGSVGLSGVEKKSRIIRVSDRFFGKDYRKYFLFLRISFVYSSFRCVSGRCMTFEIRA